MTVASTRPGVLALLGGGEFESPCNAIDTELLAAAATTEVLVIAAAAAFEDPAAVVAKATAYFAKLGATVRTLEVFNRREANDDANVRVAKNAKFFYVTDGSPMHLRSVLKDTQLFDVILGAHRRGAALAASGAGATVLCDPMIDSRGGAYTVGFGVLPNVALFAHHTNESDHIWDRAVDLLPSDATLVGVPDHSAVVRDPDGSTRVIGTVTTCVAGSAPKVHRKGAITFR